MIRPILRTRRGTGPETVLFVHGTMDHSGSFQGVAAQLDGWSAVGYDRRGWGASRVLASARTRLADHVEDVLAVATKSPGLIVTGHSYGGLVALVAAAQEPRLVKAVVAFEPPVVWLPWWPAIAPWEQLVQDTSVQGPAAAARSLQEAVLGRVIPGQTAEELHAVGTALIREMGDPSARLPSFEPTTMSVPVMTASGSVSLDHHQQTALHLAHLIPNGWHASIDGASHIAHVTHPQRLAELVAQAAAMAGR